MDAFDNYPAKTKINCCNICNYKTQTSPPLALSTRVTSDIVRCAINSTLTLYIFDYKN